MQHPTEDGSEHERLRAVPRVGIHLTHKEVFYLGKFRICCYALVIKSGIKGCFWGVFFGFFGVFFKKTLGDIFLYGLLHMLCGIYDIYVFIESRTVMYNGMGCYSWV